MFIYNSQNTKYTLTAIDRKVTTLIRRIVLPIKFMWLLHSVFFLGFPSRCVGKYIVIKITIKHNLIYEIFLSKECAIY
jgi:hypothetical protein